MNIQSSTGCYEMPQNIRHYARANIAKSANTVQSSPSPSSFEPQKSSNKQLVNLGKVTQSTPTISHLLKKSDLKDQCWNIIYDSANADKPFNKIRPGTSVAYDPSSGQLLWGKSLSDFESQIAQTTIANPTSPLEPENIIAPKNTIDSEDIITSENTITSENIIEFKNTKSEHKDLSSAVKSFIGKDYDDMDCFELVVGGLQNLGFQYKGKNGLGRHLMNQAVAKGLPQNAYLNGEGLVSESGKPVYKKTLYQVGDPKIEADALMNEMKDLLAQGQVLSFSTQTKGHTGVISKESDQWTFINSGRMDHDIRGDNGEKKVGEEDLKMEIENWLTLAKKKKQGLKITLGSLNLDQLSSFKPNSISQKA